MINDKIRNIAVAAACRNLADLHISVKKQLLGVCNPHINDILFECSAGRMLELARKMTATHAKLLGNILWLHEVGNHRFLCFRNAFLTRFLDSSSKA